MNKKTLSEFLVSYFLFYFVVISSWFLLSLSTSCSTCVASVQMSSLTPALWALPCSQCRSTCTSSFRWFSSYFSLCCCCCCRFLCSVFSPVSPVFLIFLPVFPVLLLFVLLLVFVFLFGFWGFLFFAIDLPAFECVVFGSYYLYPWQTQLKCLLCKHTIGLSHITSLWSGSLTNSNLDCAILSFIAALCYIYYLFVCYK